MAAQKNYKRIGKFEERSFLQIAAQGPLATIFFIGKQR